MATTTEATRISTSKARASLSLVVDSVRTEYERIILTQHGRDVAAIIPIEDLVLLEELEDRADLVEVRRRIRESTGSITLNQLKRELAADAKKSKPIKARAG